MYQVRVGGKTLIAEEGELLSELLMRHGISAPHPCSGRGVCKKCRAIVDGQEILTCQYRIERDVDVFLPSESALSVKDIASADEKSSDELFLVLDIGTTTLIMALCSIDGKILRKITCANPQAVFGADVISRIDACSRLGAKTLQAPLISRINEMISCMGRVPVRMLVSGNATMLHLLFGEDCSPMGYAPYTPRFLEKREVSASALGIVGVRELTSLPSAHAFVGADIIAGLATTDMPQRGKWSLFVDLGTNAEIVLFSGERILCTAAAAGPCFEGSNIECGMSAASGAICSFAAIGGENVIETVDGARPVGLCATGLIDAIYELLRLGEIDESGYLDGRFYLADGVYISPADVRQLQLAKSAVHSAIEALLDIAGIEWQEVEKLYISGGFAAKLSIPHATVIGLIPRQLSDRCVIIEDSCVMGTLKYAVGDDAELNDLAEKAEYCDLTSSDVFKKAFIKNMGFVV